MSRRRARAHAPDDSSSGVSSITFLRDDDGSRGSSRPVVDGGPPSDPALVSLVGALNESPGGLTVLVVGVKGKEKLRLANVLASSDPSINVRTSTTIEAPEGSLRPHIDYVVLMLDVTSLASLASVRSSLGKLELECFVECKVCVVVCNASKRNEFAFSNANLHELAEDVPLLYADFDRPSSMQDVANRLVSNARICARKGSTHVSTFLLETIDMTL